MGAKQCGGWILQSWPGIGWSRYSFKPRGKGDSITSSWRCYQWIESAYFTLFIRASFKVKGMIQPACMFCVWNLMTTLCLHNEYSLVEIHQVYWGRYNNMALCWCSRNWICNTAKWSLPSTAHDQRWDSGRPLGGLIRFFSYLILTSKLPAQLNCSVSTLRLESTSLLMVKIT